MEQAGLTLASVPVAVISAFCLETMVATVSMIDCLQMLEVVPSVLDADAGLDFFTTKFPSPLGMGAVIGFLILKSYPTDDEETLEDGYSTTEPGIDFSKFYFNF